MSSAFPEHRAWAVRPACPASADKAEQPTNQPDHHHLGKRMLDEEQRLISLRALLGDEASSSVGHALAVTRGRRRAADLALGFLGGSATPEPVTSFLRELLEAFDGLYPDQVDPHLN